MNQDAHVYTRFWGTSFRLEVRLPAGFETPIFGFSFTVAIINEYMEEIRFPLLALKSVYSIFADNEETN